MRSSSEQPGTLEERAGQELWWSHCLSSSHFQLLDLPASHHEVSLQPRWPQVPFWPMPCNMKSVNRLPSRRSFVGRKGKQVSRAFFFFKPPWPLLGNPWDMVTQDVMSGAVASVLQPHGEGLENGREIDPVLNIVKLFSHP